jgi:alpha-amylase
MPGTEPVAARDPGSKLAADWHRGAFMQIFVRAYQDSNHDGIGDLRGLISRLDYLADLGVRGLWLMPIHPCQDGDHGYAVTDYRAINPDYGTLEDFDELLAQAHARGIGVIIDYLINHSAAKHPLFLASRSGRGSPYRNWYLWHDKAPAGWQIYGADPWRRDDSGAYFAAFSRHMPDFNWRHPDVAAWHHDNLRFWLNRGVDGFRFDAVGHLIENGPDAWDCQPENLAPMAAIRRLLDSYEQRFMVCEIPGEPQRYAAGAGSAFAFDLNAALVGAARGEAGSLQQVARYFETAPHTISTLLSNHDSFAGRRVFNQLGGDEARCKLAAAMLLLLPGTPFVYYGEELGMAGLHTLTPDPALRTPMSWSAVEPHGGFSSVPPFRALAPNVSTHNAQRQLAGLSPILPLMSPDSLLGHYRAMIGLRNLHPAIRHGAYAAAAAGLDSGAFVFHRRLAAEHIVVAVNTGASRADALVDGLAPGALMRRLYPAGAPGLRADAQGQSQVAVEPLGVAVFGR